MINPYWRLWVDWNGNGIWGEADENITADVMDLQWRWGRPLSAGAGGDERLPSAGLSLVLRNPDGKYSPRNPASVLAQNLQVGRKVWAAFAYPCDGFDGPDGAPLAGRAAPWSSGLPWVKETAGNGGIILDDGSAKPTPGVGQTIYTLDLGDADAPLGFYYRRAGNAHSGVVLRFISQWHYLRIRFGDVGTLLEDVNWGYPSALNRGDPLTVGVNYFIELESHGTAIRLFATDLDGGTAERKEVLNGRGLAGKNSATKHGLWHDGSAAAVADRWAGFGGWRSFFCGALEQIAPAQDPALGSVCRLRAADDMERLGRVKLFNLLSGRNLKSGPIAGRILTWAGFNPNWRRLDQGETLLTSEPRALWQVTARSALRSLQREEDGFIYLDGRGYFRLESAQHRQQAPHTDPRATFDDGLTGGPYFSRLIWDEGGDGVENAVSFRYRRAENLGLQEIWRLREAPAIPAGSTRDFLAESGSYAVAARFRRPQAKVDYTAHSRADGGGTDLTEFLSVSLPLAVDAGAGYQGKGTLVRVENSHPSATAYVTRLRLQADRAYQNYEATSYRSTAGPEQTGYGLRSGEVDCRFIDNYRAARQGAEARLSRKKTPRTGLILTLLNDGDQNLTQMAQRVLSDRIRIRCRNPNIDADFFVEGMELKAVAAAGRVELSWRLQVA